MFRRFLTILLLLILAAGSANSTQKESPLPKGLPPYGKLKAFPAPQVATRKFANGLTLWLVPRPGFPKISYTLAVRGGHVG